MPDEPLIYVRYDRAWALDVAKQFADTLTSPPDLDDVWVDDELALCARYRIGGERLAVRHDDLDVAPSSSLAPTDSGRLASDLFHNLGALDGERAYTDPDGYRWWGTPPPGGWDHPAPRIATFLPR